MKIVKVGESYRSNNQQAYFFADIA